MNKPKVKSNINNILATIEAIKSGKSTINKENNDSNFQESIYTPESILASIKISAESALKALDEYE